MKKLSPLFLAGILLSLAAGAQPFQHQAPLQNRPAAKKATFWDIQRAFDNYWRDKTPSREESDNAEEGGYQQFKRWEWFTMQRTYPSGEFPNPEILFSEYQSYKSTLYGNNARSTGANWSFIGPGVVPGNGGGAGRINCITLDPSNASVIWVGTACGGLWKSTNGGVSWTSNTDLLPSLSVSDIVIDPSNPQIMYLATGDKYGIYWQYETWGHYSAGILKSTDGGVTWNPTGMSYTLANVTVIQRLIIDPTSTNKLYAATNMGIFATTDGGNTWSNLRSGLHYDIEMNPANSSMLYAGDSTGVIRSTDGGATWNYVPGVTSTGRTSIAVTPANAGVIYAWTEGGGFYYSNNAGVSFAARTDPSSNVTPYGYYDMVLEVSPVNENILVTGGLDIGATTDGGLTWNTVSDWAGWPNSNYVHADNHALKFAPGSSTSVYSCNDGGIFHSIDGGATWGDLSSGISIKQYYRLSASFLTSNLIYAGAQDNGTDRVMGLNTATQIMGADGEECLVDYTDDNIVFASSQGGYFQRSTDGGVTFNPISAFGCDWTSPILMDPTDHNRMFLGGSDVFKSVDNGVNWTNITNGAFDATCIYSLEMCNSNPNYIYAATFGHIYRTINGGTTWTDITSTLPVNSAAISGIAVSDADPDHVWVTFSGFSNGNKVFNTTDGGATWINVSGTLPNIPANCIEYQNASNDLLYIGTDLGVFYTDATQNNWIPYNNGLPAVIVDELEISYPNSKLRAATYGRGLWESDLQTSTLMTLDASTLSMVAPPVTTCDTVITPVVRIRNGGMDTLFSVELHYRMDTQPLQVYNYNGALPSLATYNVTLPTYTLSSGTHTLQAYTANPNSSTDMNPNNDTITRTFTILGNFSATAPPLAEGFVSAAFPPSPWTLENSSNLWSRDNTVGGFSLSTSCAAANFYSISAGDDKIISPYFDFSNAIAPIRLFFDVAYGPYPGYSDSLFVDLYTDCGGPIGRIYAKGGTNLSTAQSTTNVFSPAANEWRTETINLDSLAGHAPVQVRFIAHSGYGNMMYLDNINLTANGVGLTPSPTVSQMISVFPNPAGNMVNVEINAADNAKVIIKVMDVLGNVVQTANENVSPGITRKSLDVSSLSEGVYLVQVQVNDTVYTQRIVVAR